MIDVDADELTGYGARKQRRADGGINSARKTEQHALFADLSSDLLYLAGEVVLHGVVARRTADAVEEVVYHLAAVFGVFDFGMELHAEYLLTVVFKRGDGAECRRGDGAEACGEL